eukprot:TRINITY_DN1104_c1_g1_i2.p1 TRINITY_DN1104_c1_g1~~TRINITY_DN1104_c1_g1_i2.p1  ORF type:complete len:165 (+),score=52.21 TRINITY_DN1104_c1_g1_i2:60-497(+)
MSSSSTPTPTPTTTTTKVAFQSSAFPPPLAPYSPAIAVGGFLFLSGQIGQTPEGVMMEGVVEQTKRVFTNIELVLASANLTLSDVVKVTVFMQNMSDYAAINEVYAKAFENHAPFPARSAVEVARLPKDALVEIEVMAKMSEPSK